MRVMVRWAVEGCAGVGVGWLRGWLWWFSWGCLGVWESAVWAGVWGWGAYDCVHLVGARAVLTCVPQGMCVLLFRCSF